MAKRIWIATLTLAAGLSLLAGAAQAFDESKYPDWKGKWQRPLGERPVWVKPPDKAPLTAEYQAIFDWDVADQKAGGHGTEPSWMCLPPGMPRAMNVFEPMEIVITPKVTFVLISHIHDNRRIYTDGRDWPANADPSYFGYSIGRWIDEDGDGRYDVLEVETRNFMGPRSFDNAGIPLHADNETVIRERIYRDKQDPRVIHDEMTTIDHALTRPWTVDKTYRLTNNPEFVQNICSVGNVHVVIGKDAYFLSAEGLLMPTKKGQGPPDLRYFRQTRQ